MVDIKEDKKMMRGLALDAWYKVKHGGGVPQDSYELYMLEMVKALGEVYDDTMDSMRAELRRCRAIGKGDCKSELLDRLRNREKALESLGRIMRRAINIHGN